MDNNPVCTRSCMLVLQPYTMHHITSQQVMSPGSARITETQHQLSITTTQELTIPASTASDTADWRYNILTESLPTTLRKTALK